MKSLVLFVSFLGALAAQASPQSDTLKKVLESQTSCENFVRFNDKNIFLGFGPYRRGLEEPRQPIPGVLRVVPLQGKSFDLATHDAAIDVVQDGDTAFVLTYSSIEEWNLKSKKFVAEYVTYDTPPPLAYLQHASGMARYENKLVIAHGRLGVSIFDIPERRLRNQFRLLSSQLPKESQATGVTIQGHFAFLSVDSFTLNEPEDAPAFRGIVKLDLDQEAVVSEMVGLDPGAESITSDGHELLVSWGQIIWKYSFNKMDSSTLSTTLPEPDIRIWSFPIKGHPEGAAAIDDKYYYTCFAFPAGNSNYSYRPVALSRKDLHID